MIKQEVDLSQASNLTLLEEFLDSFYDPALPVRKRLRNLRKRLKCRVEHEHMVFYPECLLERGNGGLRRTKVVIPLTYLNSPITLLASRNTRVCIDGIKNPGISQTNTSAGLFHVNVSLKIFHSPSNSVIFQQSAFDYEIREALPVKTPINAALVSAHYLANSFPITAQDTEDQRIVFLSDNTVGSRGLSLTLKVQCGEEIRKANEFSGEGQFDFLIVKLSEDLLVSPEAGIQVKTDLKGSRFKEAGFVGLVSNQVLYQPDTAIPKDSLFHLTLKNIPRLLFYKRGLTHSVFCVRNRVIFEELEYPELSPLPAVLDDRAVTLTSLNLNAFGRSVFIKNLHQPFALQLDLSTLRDEDLPLTSSIEVFLGGVITQNDSICHPDVNSGFEAFAETPISCVFDAKRRSFVIRGFKRVSVQETLRVFFDFTISDVDPSSVRTPFFKISSLC